MGFEMARRNKNFQAGDGIVSGNVNCTVCRIGQLAREGMTQTNKTIVKIMVGKPCYCKKCE